MNGTKGWKFAQGRKGGSVHGIGVVATFLGMVMRMPFKCAYFSGNLRMKDPKPAM